MVKTVTENTEATVTLLTIREASRLLHVHENTMRRWSNQGLIRTYRVGPGGHRRFKTEDITVLLVEQPTMHRAKPTIPPKFPKRAKVMS